MKLGIITTSYPRFPGDMAGNFVAGHVEALRALGHDVEVLAAGPGSAQAADAVRIASGLFYRGGAPDLIDASPIRGVLAGVSFTARIAREVARRASRWELAIAHWLAPSAIAALPARVPVVAIAHGGDIHLLRRLRLLAPVLYALRARRARLVFVSEQLRDIARAEVPALARWLATALVQPMGIALDRFHSLERAPIVPPTIVVASRLVPLKGIDVAIAAMGYVRTPARLVIAGEGPARATLRAASSERIRFLGEVPVATRDQLLSEASVVVVPSRVMANGRTEGTPLIALEALAAGVPVVASAVGGLQALAELRLVPPDDPHALATAIDRILANPPPADTLRRSVAHLDWPVVARRICER